MSRVVVQSPAFYCTGIDMFGPIQIRLNRKTLKEAQAVIFVCITTRAVHLELVTDRSTDTFLMAFRRFACTRGHPALCFSDCGTNFKGAEPYISEVTKNWDKKKIKKELAEEFSCNFEGEWNVLKASHMNGVTESLIKSVRQALDATCRNPIYSEEQWRTILTEISYTVNSRPLYPSSDAIWENPPITPNDLLIGPHVGVPVPIQEDKVNPRHLHKSTQQRIHHFWTAWMKYFAPTLLRRDKWYRPRDNLKSGDLVLEVDSCPRRKWKMALVEEVFPGKDGKVRKAKIKTQTSSFERPIHKLCLIATKEELSSNVK
ncbi:uncharacterized protein LOC125570079 [Nematostella vectensis]|uniref:uncharacterized protein LOC125570079 n=1 Tax=Nematostella vectensis TaxID=45351 RepID=UPI002077931E|nr:uncharacterized protein LOC125570079 [Nematostella vectensis]